MAQHPCRHLRTVTQRAAAHRRVKAFFDDIDAAVAEGHVRGQLRMKQPQFQQERRQAPGDLSITASNTVRAGARHAQ